MNRGVNTARLKLSFLLFFYRKNDKLGMVSRTGEAWKVGNLKITAEDIKKALEEKLDEWEEYIKEVDRRNLKAAKLARDFWVRWIKRI